MRREGWAGFNTIRHRSGCRWGMERAYFDGQNGSLSITFHPTGIKALGAEMDEPEEAAA